MKNSRKTSFTLLRRDTPRPGAGGFTLLEAMVVSLLIVILASMVLGAIGRMRSRARNTECQNNLHNLHVAVLNHLCQFQCLPASRSYESYDPYSPVYWSEGQGWIVWREWAQHPDPTNDWTARRPGKPDVWWGSLGVTCITNGTLWHCGGENLKAYLCPVFARTDVMGDRAPDGSSFGPANPAVRSYVMNSQASHRSFYDLVGADRVLLFADGHPDFNVQALARDGSGSVRICRQGLLQDTPPAPDSYYVSVPDACFGYVEPCPYDCQLTGVPDVNAVPAEAYPVESVGVLHGPRIINGVAHPVGNAVFIDGHIEQLTWWQTTNACSGNW